MKPTKHFIERMLERCISAKMVSQVLENHKAYPGNTDQELKLVGAKITIVVSKQQTLVTCYFNYEIGAY